MRGKDKLLSRVNRGDGKDVRTALNKFGLQKSAINKLRKVDKKGMGYKKI